MGDGSGEKIMHMIVIRHAISKYGIELDQEYTMKRKK